MTNEDATIDNELYRREEAILYGKRSRLQYDSEEQFQQTLESLQNESELQLQRLNKIEDLLGVKNYKEVIKALFKLEKEEGVLQPTGWCRHPKYNNIAWKAGIDFRTAAEYVIVTINRKDAINIWPEAGARFGWLHFD